MHKPTRGHLFCLLMLIVACSGEHRAQPPLVSGNAMGTTYSVKFGEPLSELRRNELQADVAGTIEAVEQSMSTYRSDSELSGFNRYDGGDWFPVSLPLCEVVAAALELSAASNGAFDVTVGPVVDRWGFGPGELASEIPGEKERQSLLASTGYRNLEADCAKPALRKAIPGLSIDLSAIAKGFGVDRVAAMLDEQNVENYLVEIGGELRARGRHPAGRPWRIGIEDSRRADGAASRVLPLKDRSVATSGDYRNYFVYEGKRYSHTIDPRTAAPVTHDLAAVTVVADSAMLADGWATALLVLGPEQGPALASRLGLAAGFQGHDETSDLRMTAELQAQIQLEE